MSNRLTQHQYHSEGICYYGGYSLRTSCLREHMHPEVIIECYSQQDASLMRSETRFSLCPDTDACIDTFDLDTIARSVHPFRDSVRFIRMHYMYMTEVKTRLPYMIARWEGSMFLIVVVAEAAAVRVLADQGQSMR